MSYSVDPIPDNCYEGTTCLINIFGIRDEDALADLESKITVAKSAELELESFKDGFNEDDYRAIHRFLFEQLYDWAANTEPLTCPRKEHPLQTMRRYPT